MPTFDATDFNNAVSESGTAHESTANTDHTDASQLKQGYDIANPYLSADLVGYWPLQEDSGSTAYDFSGNNNDGSINGTVTQGATGPLGTTSYDFGGGYLNVPDAASLDITGGLTVSFWLRWDTSGSGHTQGVVSKAGSGAGSGYSIKVDDPTSGDPLEVRIDGTGYAFGNSVPTGIWKHYAWVQSSSTSYLYEDGSQVDSVSTETLDTTNNDSMYIGANRWNTGNNLLGALWDVRVYNTALSSSQVETLSLYTPNIMTLSEGEQTKRFGEPDSNVSNPIVDSANFSWTSGGLYEYSNVVYESSATNPYKWWVTGVDGSGGTVGLLTSSDGYTWNNDDTNNPLGIGSGYEDPYIVPPAEHSVDSSTYYMFVERNSDNTTVRFSGTDPYAINSGEDVVLKKGGSGAWDENNAASPIAFEYGGTWYLMYEGIPATGDAKLGIATASTVDAAGPWSKSADNPIIDGNDFGYYASNDIVCDQLFQRASDGRWFLTLHTVDDSNVRHRAILYSDVDPPNWTDSTDWTELSANPIPWDRHGDTSNHSHTAATWEHPDDSELHIMINGYKKDTVYQDRLYESSVTGSLTTQFKTV